MNMLAEKVYVYANQRLHENTDNAVYQNLASRAQSLLVEMSERTSYIEPGDLGAARRKPLRNIYRKTVNFGYMGSILKI